MIYKGWYLSTELIGGTIIVRHRMGRLNFEKFIIVAHFERKILRPTFKENLPYIGRQTIVDDGSIEIRWECRSLREGLIKVKEIIDRHGEIKRVIIDDPWAMEKIE